MRKTNEEVKSSILTSQASMSINRCNSSFLNSQFVSPMKMWLIMDMPQIYKLMVLIGAYIPYNIRYYLEGVEFFSFFDSNKYNLAHL